MIFFIAQLSKKSNEIHGASIINDNMFMLLCDKFELFQTHYTNKITNNALINYVVFIFQFFITSFLNIKKRKYLYISYPADFGLIKILPIFLLSFFFRKIFIHFHSSNIFVKRNFIHYFLFFILCKKLNLIFLCKNMKYCYLKYYPAVSSSKIIPNSTFYKIESFQSNLFENNKDITLGFLSNITIDKGIIDFIEVVRFLKDNDIANINAIVGGNFISDKLKKYCIQISKGLPIKFIGGVYGKKKSLFFKEIDLLIFPSIYKNEADPLVIQEALENKKIVFAYDIGCISEVLPKKYVFKSKKFLQVAIYNFISNKQSLSYQSPNLGYVFEYDYFI